MGQSAPAAGLFLQQLQRQVSTLRTDMTTMQGQIDKMQGELAELKLGRPQLLEDQRQYRKLLRRNIIVRARDLLSHEGGQLPDSDFYEFSTRLSTAFLEARNLTQSTIIRMNGPTVSEGDAIAHPASPEELKELCRGLEGLTGAKLHDMTLLYNFVVQREQS